MKNIENSFRRYYLIKALAAGSIVSTTMNPTLKYLGKDSYNNGMQETAPLSANAIFSPLIIVYLSFYYIISNVPLMMPMLGVVVFNYRLVHPIIQISP